MKHGRIITTESLFNGATHSVRVVHEESVEIKDQAHLLSEVLAALDLGLLQGDDVNLTIKRNADGKLRLVKTYRVS